MVFPKPNARSRHIAAERISPEKSRRVYLPLHGSERATDPNPLMGTFPCLDTIAASIGQARALCHESTNHPTMHEKETRVSSSCFRVFVVPVAVATASRMSA